MSNFTQQSNSSLASEILLVEPILEKLIYYQDRLILIIPSHMEALSELESSEESGVHPLTRQKLKVLHDFVDSTQKLLDDDQQILLLDQWVREACVYEQSRQDAQDATEFESWIGPEFRNDPDLWSEVKSLGGTNRQMLGTARKMVLNSYRTFLKLEPALNHYRVVSEKNPGNVTFLERHHYDTNYQAQLTFPIEFANTEWSRLPPIFLQSLSSTGPDEWIAMSLVCKMWYRCRISMLDLVKLYGITLISAQRSIRGLALPFRAQPKDEGDDPRGALHLSDYTVEKYFGTPEGFGYLAKPPLGYIPDLVLQTAAQGRMQIRIRMPDHSLFTMEYRVKKSGRIPRKAVYSCLTELTPENPSGIICNHKFYTSTKRVLEKETESDEELIEKTEVSDPQRLEEFKRCGVCLGSRTEGRTKLLFSILPEFVDSLNRRFRPINPIVTPSTTISLALFQKRYEDLMDPRLYDPRLPGYTGPMVEGEWPPKSKAVMPDYDKYRQALTINEIYEVVGDLWASRPGKNWYAERFNPQEVARMTREKDQNSPKRTPENSDSDKDLETSSPPAEETSKKSKSKKSKRSRLKKKFGLVSS